MRGVNLAAKTLLVGLLLYAVLRPDLPQFQGKAMEARPSSSAPPPCCLR